MKKKISLIIIFMLFIAMTIPSVGGIEDKNDVNQKFKRFLFCYVETKTFGEFEKTGTFPFFGIGLIKYCCEDSETAIYSEENGNMLWNFEGRHILWITFYRGYTEVIEESSTMYGNAFNVRIFS